MHISLTFHCAIYALMFGYFCYSIESAIVSELMRFFLCNCIDKDKNRLCSSIKASVSTNSAAAGSLCVSEGFLCWHRGEKQRPVAWWTLSCSARRPFHLATGQSWASMPNQSPLWSELLTQWWPTSQCRHNDLEAACTLSRSLLELETSPKALNPRQWNQTGWKVKHATWCKL